MANVPSEKLLNVLKYFRKHVIDYTWLVIDY